MRQIGAWSISFLLQNSSQNLTNITHTNDFCGYCLVDCFYILMHSINVWFWCHLCWRVLLQSSVSNAQKILIGIGKSSWNKFHIKWFIWYGLMFAGGVISQIHTLNMLIQFQSVSLIFALLVFRQKEKSKENKTLSFCSIFNVFYRLLENIRYKTLPGI